MKRAMLEAAGSVLLVAVLGYSAAAYSVRQKLRQRDAHLFLSRIDWDVRAHLRGVKLPPDRRAAVEHLMQGGQVTMELP